MADKYDDAMTDYRDLLFEEAEEMDECFEVITLDSVLKGIVSANDKTITDPLCNIRITTETWYRVISIVVEVNCINNTAEDIRFTIYARLESNDIVLKYSPNCRGSLTIDHTLKESIENIIDHYATVSALSPQQEAREIGSIWLNFKKEDLKWS